MNQGFDKRRFPRVSVNFVTVEVYAEEGQARDPEMCFVINLSENGMMFRGNRTYETGQHILLTFTIADSDTVIRTDAAVVHKQELETSRFFGVQFLSLGEVERELLRSYVAAALEKKD